MLHKATSMLTIGRTAGLLRSSRRPTTSIMTSSFARRCLSSTTTDNDVQLRIVFGSQSGTAEAFAYDLEFDAQEANIHTEIIDALNFSPKDLIVSKSSLTPQRSVTAFIFACYGEGEPTDNAKHFYTSLLDPTTPSIEGANFAVFGLGNSQCFQDRFNVVGKHLDERLNALHGHRALPLMLGDASPALTGKDTMAERFAEWKRQLIQFCNQLSEQSTNNNSSKSSDDVNNKSISTPQQQQSTTSDNINNQSSSSLSSPSSMAPLSLSQRQLSMVPTHRPLLSSTVSHVTQLFARTDEFTSAVEVEFDLSRTTPIVTNNNNNNNSDSLTKGLQAGDHIGVFAPNSSYVIARFALAAGLTQDDLDKPFDLSSSANTSTSPSTTTLRQVLTWQVHLSAIASHTSIKLLHRYLAKQPQFTQTTAFFAQLEDKYDQLVRDKGMTLIDILDMIPKIHTNNNTTSLSTEIMNSLIKTLPTLNPRLYSITHMVVNEDRELAIAAKHAVDVNHNHNNNNNELETCPVSGSIRSTTTAISTNTPTSSDDFTKITLLCRLLRYRNTKSSSSRVIDGVCSSYLCERLRPDVSDKDNNHNVAIFFRESNFHLPAASEKISTSNTTSDSASSTPPPPVIMIAGGSGLAPFMSFLEHRQRQLMLNNKSIGPAYLYFGCRNDHEYMFRDKLVDYLDSNHVLSTGHSEQPTLNRLVVSFSTTHKNLEGTQNTTEAELSTLPRHPSEVVHALPHHIPDVVLQDREVVLPLIRGGAHIYVCGGAGQFGKAVREVVNTLTIEALGLHEKGEHYNNYTNTNTSINNKDSVIHPGIRYLIQSKRYFEDLAD